MTEREVVIAGAGPTGLMLSAELALAGVDVVVVERRPGQERDVARAGGLHARTIEVLDQRGIADRFVAAGQPMQIAAFGGIRLELGDFPTRHPYGVALRQSHTERLLAEWADELAVPVLRGREVTGFAQNADGVDVALSDGSSIRAAFLVGCDGGRSLVRKGAGIEFVGWDPTTAYLMAEVATTEQPVLGVRREGGGIGPADPGSGRFQMVVRAPVVDEAGAPSLQDLRDALVAAYGTDFGAHDPTSVTRFSDNTRQASAYRAGRVLLAGDAAHVHPPQGGQGLNLGVQDAVNLGWKLAQVVHGTSPASLLDTYHAERHPVGSRVLQGTMAQVALATPDDRHDALKAILGDVLVLDEPRRHLAGMLSGLDIRYDVGDGHPTLGRRVPDLDLQTADGPTRVYTLLHDARPLLLSSAATAVAGAIRTVVARYDDVWDLPVLGEVAAPSAALIRPDGYVAWAGDVADPQLGRSVETWFGAGRMPGAEG